MADVLELLIAERDRLDQAIAVLQGPRRRGRPPGSGKKVDAKKERNRRRRGSGCLRHRGSVGLRRRRPEKRRRRSLPSSGLLALGVRFDGPAADERPCLWRPFGRVVSFSC